MPNTSSPATGTPAQQLSSIPRFGFIGTPSTAGAAAAPFGLPNANSSQSSASASLSCLAPAHPTGLTDNSTSISSSSGSDSTTVSTKPFGMVNGCQCDIGSSNGAPSVGYHNGGVAGHHKGNFLPGFHHHAPTNRNRSSGLNHSSVTKSHIAESSARSAPPSGQLTAPQADQIAAGKEEANVVSSTTTLDSSRISLLPALSSTTFNTASATSSITYNRSRTKSLESPDIAVSSSAAENLNFSSSKHISALKFSATSLHQLAQASKMSTTPATKLPNHRLIKSQSLRFDSSSHQNGTGTSQIARSAKLSAHSLDTVDKLAQDYTASSKLPRSLAHSKVDSNVMEEEPIDLPDQQTPGTLSRSSTASLGVLSNLNEVLAAAGDCSDYDEDPEFGAKLAAIDESLSPLPSLGSIEMNITSEVRGAENNKLPGDSTIPNWSEMETTTIAKSPNASHTTEPVATDLEHEDISLNSIEISENFSSKTEIEPAEPVQSKAIETTRSLVKDTQEHKSSSVATSSRLNNTPMSGKYIASGSRFSTPQAPTYSRLQKGAFPALSSTGKKSSATSRVGSSKASSGNVSRTTTPTLSESEFGELNSLSSITSGVSLSRAVASKLSAQSKVTNQRLTSQRVLPANASKSNQLDLKRGRASVAPKKTESNVAPLSKSISRSTTYTRSLNAAATNRQQPQPTTLLGHSKSIAKSDSTKTTKVASGKGFTASATATSSSGAQFAKPTTSYLKKTTTKTVLPSNAVPHQPKRPSSVASNCSSVASSHQTTTTTKKSLLSSHAPVTAARSPASAIGAKRSPATTSRRSSITSPSKPAGSGLASSSSSPHTVHKQTTTEQLRKYQALYWQQTELIKRLRQELRQAGIHSAALLAINAHLINEYSPFETPSLRAELASLHHKSCTLHRDYELSKETVLQREATILELETKLWEQSKELDVAHNEVESLKGKLADVEAHLVEGEEDRRALQDELQELRQELESEKEEHSNVLSKLNALEESCRSDKKYRDLKEKISNYQKEVDSLNYVVDIKTQRVRHLESEVMLIKLELANYESLRESFQQLQRENEALTETVGMKARKNAEQSREIDSLRADLKRVANERKRASIRNEQLEFQLDETREMLNELSFANMSSILENDNDTSQVGTPSESGNTAFVPRFFSSVSQSKNGASSSLAVHRNLSRSHVRRHLSMPSPVQGQSEGHGEFQSHRQHFQHQEPISSDTKHRLPELVLSSIGANNWSMSSRPGTSSSSSSHCDNGQSDCHSSSKSSSNCNSANSSPLASFKDYTAPNSSMSTN